MGDSEVEGVRGRGNSGRVGGAVMEGLYLSLGVISNGKIIKLAN